MDGRDKPDHDSEIASINTGSTLAGGLGASQPKRPFSAKSRVQWQHLLCVSVLLPQLQQ